MALKQIIQTMKQIITEKQMQYSALSKAQCSTFILALK
jgi:hypothetical protein